MLRDWLGKCWCKIVRDGNSISHLEMED